MTAKHGLKSSVSRFLEAWLATRQIIQAANFNRFQSAGLSATQFMTLNLIPARGEGTTLTELARRMNLGAATLTKTLDSLEQRGLLTRTRSEVDRRLVMLALTKDGEALQNAASKEFHGQMASIFKRMNATQREALVSGLEGFLAASAKPSGAKDDGAVPASRSSARSPRRRS